MSDPLRARASLIYNNLDVTYRVMSAKGTCSTAACYSGELVEDKSRVTWADSLHVQ